MMLMQGRHDSCGVCVCVGGGGAPATEHQGVASKPLLQQLVRVRGWGSPNTRMQDRRTVRH